MKRRMLHLMFFAIALSVMHGCGGADTAPPYGGPTATAPHPEPVKLVSRHLLSDQRWRYVIGLSADAISGAKTAPFVMGGFNGWRVDAISDADSDGYYEATITTFNREIALSYGGDYLAGSWARIDWSSYFVQLDNAIVIGFYEGRLYIKGAAPFSPPPGQVGDSFVRFALSGNSLTTYYNNNKVGGSLAHPFHIGNYSGWVAGSQAVADSDGWGYMTMPVNFPADIIFGYGGDYAGGSWVNPYGSDYYDPALNSFHICVSSGTVTSGSCH